MFRKMKKKLLLIKKPYDFERKHTKMRYNSQNLLCKTYTLEYLIAKTFIFYFLFFFVYVSVAVTRVCWPKKLSDYHKYKVAVPRI